jgi:pimeloyl-ACP methyl ester carboxylesterase
MGPPRLLLVHGAFHGRWCWERLTPELERLGITYEAVELPFTSPQDDMTTVRRALESSTESVAVVGHSFGGAVISAAAALDGVPCGMARSLIYLAAFMSAPGQSIDFGAAPGIAELELGEESASVAPEAARRIFYNKCSVEDADWATAQLRKMPTATLTAAPPVSPAWRVLPSTYVVCTQDRILSPAAQEQMAHNAGRVVRMDADHSPFLSCPRALADVLHSIISDN